MSTTPPLTRVNDHALSYQAAPSSTPLFDDVYDIDSDGFLNSQQRAGGPYLCSLPTRKEAFNKNITTQDNVQILKATGEILNEHGIQYIEISLKGRQSKVDPEPEPVPTVVVVTKRNSPGENWREVSKQIHRYASTRYNGVSVELIDDNLDQRFNCLPVLHTDSINAKWRHIQETIFSRLDIVDWTSLECWRYGTSLNKLENPVTIIVSIRKKSLKQFHTDLQRIREILSSFNETEVSILFMKDEMWG